MFEECLQNECLTYEMECAGYAARLHWKKRELVGNIAKKMMSHMKNDHQITRHHLLFDFHLHLRNVRCNDVFW